ncbi:MAG TPA: 6-carboxytetrahydropterin synthase QueD [Bryobacteraceae bacterium]|nr:6-carboxytetrahydropterin synthase QueD [Bryobacteraceae bacterium]
MFEVSVEETFAAGHALRNYRGKCENVHGHNYRVQVTFSGPELDATGLLVDFVVVKKLMQAVVDRLDHQFLNDLAPFDSLNPSAENIAKYFYDEIRGGLERGASVQLGHVRIWETDTSSATYRP